MDGNTLTTSDFFAALSEDEVEALLALCEKRRFAEGDIIFSEGDEGDEIFIVETGSVRVSKSVSLEADHTLAMIERGGIFGEMAVLEESGRSATALALAATELLAVTGEAFQTLVADRPQTGLKLLRDLTRTVVQRLRLTNDLLRDTVAWGLEVSGAASLSFRQLMTDSAAVDLALRDGRRVQGRIVKVERGEGRLELFVCDAAERVHIVPYHAIVETIFAAPWTSSEQAAAGEEL